MATLFGRRQKVGLAQHGKVLTRRLWRYAGDVSEFGRGQCAAVDQRQQNVGARRIADQRRNFGNRRLRLVHGEQIDRRSNPRQPRQFGNCRSNATADWARDDVGFSAPERTRRRGAVKSWVVTVVRRLYDGCTTVVRPKNRQVIHLIIGKCAHGKLPRIAAAVVALCIGLHR